MRFPKPMIRLLGRVQGAIYRATGGRWVGKVGSAGVLLLTTTGRRSGKSRTVPLLYVPDGDAFVIVASQGGHDTHPAWYLNLLANPAATVQIGKRVMNVRARWAGPAFVCVMLRDASSEPTRVLRRKFFVIWRAKNPLDRDAAFVHIGPYGRRRGQRSHGETSV